VRAASRHLHLPAQPRARNASLTCLLLLLLSHVVPQSAIAGLRIKGDFEEQLSMDLALVRGASRFVMSLRLELKPAEMEATTCLAGRHFNAWMENLSALRFCSNF